MIKVLLVEMTPGGLDFARDALKRDFDIETILWENGSSLDANPLLYDMAILEGSGAIFLKVSFERSKIPYMFILKATETPPDGLSIENCLWESACTAAMLPILIKSAISRNISETMYQNLVDNSLVGISLLDGEEIVYANNKIAQMFGLKSGGDAMGLKFSSLIRPEFKLEFDAAIAGPRDQSREIELLVEKGGKTSHFLIMIKSCVLHRRDLNHLILIDISRRKDIEDSLRDMSFRDALTGVYNRHFLYSEIISKLNSLAMGESIAFIIADVDELKGMNDLYGHLAGDDVLKKVAILLKRSVRASDYVIRYGGDEFLIVVWNGTDLVGILRRMHDVLENARKKGDLVVAGKKICVTLGGEIWKSGEGRNPIDIIRKADENMYLKKKRSNCY